MESAREFFLREYLPTTSDKERELWFRTSEMGQKFLEIMKNYGKLVLEEVNDGLPITEELIDDIIAELPDDYELSSREEKRIKREIEEYFEEIEKSIRNIGYQI